MKNKKNILLVAAILSALAGLVHTAICFVSLCNDVYTSFPAWTALLVLVPYVLCSSLCAVVWAVIRQKKG